MKTLTTLLAVFVLTAGFASAQSANNTVAGPTRSNGEGDVTGFKANNYPGKTPTNKQTPPNPNVSLKPKLGGIFVDGAKNGWIMINPAAPATAGIGAKYLSAPSSRADVLSYSAYAAHRDTGGFKLFSLEF